MENKILVSMIAPILTKSGYGERSRDIARAILSSDKYDLKIWPINWGNTPYIGLDKTDPIHDKLMSCILKTPNLERKPDIHIHISIPNEFQPVGNYNIGITAGIETDRIDPSWIDGSNKMNLVLVSSEHAKKGFIETTYSNKETGNQLKLTTPVEVLFEGLDVNTFFKTDDIAESVKSELNQIPEDFAFLFCGHWLQGDIGHDRKDVGMLIKTFFEVFKNKKKKPALILKTGGGSNSIVDKKSVLEKIDSIRKACSSDDLPNVYLLHGNLTREEMNSLYNHPKVKVHVSFTKGEGFGRPLLEASVSAKPILVPKHSGYLDFLEHVIWIDGTLTPIHNSVVWKGVLNEGSSWFYCNYSTAGGYMRDLFENYKNYIELGKRQAYKSRTEFTLDKMTEILLGKMNSISESIPKKIELKLPKLKKIETPKIETVIPEEIKNGK